MQFLHPERDEQLELALDDVFIVPGYFDGSTRLETDLSPSDFSGSSLPLVSANMSAVTGKRMAQAMARYGGLGVLPQDMDLATMERIVRFIKEATPHYDTALTVLPDATLRDVQGIIRKRAHDMVVVLDVERRPIGIVTQTDLRGKDQYSQVDGVMSPQPVTIPEGMPNRDAFRLLEANRVKAAPVVDDGGRLCGVLTRDDAVRLELSRPSLDSSGRLMVAAAVSIASDAPEAAARLRSRGVDVLVLDTAHGHQRRMLEALREVRSEVGPEVPLVAGNVCTEQGVQDLLEAGADVVKVNVGPGAMCTTRMQTGVGRPTFTTVLNCAGCTHAAVCPYMFAGPACCPRAVEHGGECRSPDAGLHTGGAHGARSDVYLDHVCPSFQQVLHTLLGAHIACHQGYFRSDFGPHLSQGLQHAALVTMGGVEHQNVHPPAP